MIGVAKLLEEVEVSEDDDSENKQIEESFATSSSSSDESSNSQSNSSGSSDSSSTEEISSEENALSSRTPLEHIETLIEADEGSGSEAIAEISTGGSNNSTDIQNSNVDVELSTEATKSSIELSTEAAKAELFTKAAKSHVELSTEPPKPSILTAEILRHMEDASTDGPTSSTTTPNFVEQNFDSISTSSILEETAASLVASSETKPMPTLNVDNIYQSKISKSTVVVVASCLSGIVLLTIISLVYMINFQRQTGTLDIEMQEQRCGKDSYENEEIEDETHERLLGTQEANTVNTVDDIL